jgi:hypothetical protein
VIGVAVNNAIMGSISEAGIIRGSDTPLNRQIRCRPSIVSIKVFLALDALKSSIVQVRCSNLTVYWDLPEDTTVLRPFAKVVSD